ncbi:unnamed protein product [Rotaria sp. Silwood2]|nr:unnamed protein product [Rotaria sp. Silwood2]CAF4406426.1 unnamed protein product [Rotaria sp. Silwood2]
MFNSVISYQNRVNQQQRQRRKKRKASLDVINNVDSCISSSDDDVVISNNVDDRMESHKENAQKYDTPEIIQHEHDELLYSDNFNSTNDIYISSDDDTDYNEDFVDTSHDSSSPLYENSNISVKTAASRIMSVAIEFNLSKNVIERVFKIIKTLLPIPNHLPTTHSSILKLIGTKSISSSKFYCNSCLKLCVFSISVRTQLFLADLPAKALFWKTINYNGYNACAHCLSEGIYKNRQLLYPYSKNSYRQRTHTEFLATAQAIDYRICSGKKGGSIDGIKGKSPLLKIFEYPKQVIIDYMHLCCLGHMSSLIERWLPMLDNLALDDINSKLYSQRFSHNMHVKFNYSLNLYSDWKAKHFRTFILFIGLPYVITRLPSLVASHFSLYSMFIKLLHCPTSMDEIILADKIIHYYCQTAPQIYGETIELFSLHAHLHLPQQVLTHGALCFTSAFCFESVIRHIKKKAHGTRELATQIADWIHVGTITNPSPVQLPIPMGINDIDINDSSFDTYRHNFVSALHEFIQDDNGIILYLRFKNTFVTYHSILYDLRFNCSSYIVSYKDADCSIQYGGIVIFFKYKENYYGYVQKYASTEKNINDYVSVPIELKEKLNEIFPIRRKTQSYAIVPVNSIHHKCIQVEHQDHMFLSEIRLDYEHD